MFPGLLFASQMRPARLTCCILKWFPTPRPMSGGVQPHWLVVELIAPVSWVPGVMIGLAAGLAAAAAAGAPPAAFAAASAAGSGTRNGRLPICIGVGGGRSATFTVATSVAAPGV